MNRKFTLCMTISFIIIAPAFFFMLMKNTGEFPLSFPMPMYAFRDLQVLDTTQPPVNPSVNVDTDKNKEQVEVFENGNDVIINEENRNEETASSEIADEVPHFVTSDITYFQDALFIGDSRTVGLYEYANIGDADVFASSGMSVFKVFSTKVKVKDLGKCKLETLLADKTYGKIYIMLGINEIGYDRENMLLKYGEMIDKIREAQPNAIMYLMANLHVSEKKSTEDSVYNNDAINSINASISEMCDGENVFFIDVNPLYDDENGNLNKEYTADDSHVKAKYYEQWGTWLLTQTIEKKD